MKNNIKAVVYVVLGVLGMIICAISMISMYFSSTFIPVYVGKTYVISNQLIRYAVYAILIVIAVLSAMLADYGSEYLTKKFHKHGRR